MANPKGGINAEKVDPDDAYLRTVVRDLDVAQVRMDPNLAAEDIRQGEVFERDTNVDGPHASGKV